MSDERQDSTHDPGDDDDLLEQLGALAREDEAAYPADVEAWLRGETTREQLLLSRSGEDRTELEALLDLLEPGRQQTGAEWAAKVVPPPAPERRRWLTAAVGATSLAAAAALVFWLAPSGSDNADRRTTVDGGPTGTLSDARFSLVVRDTPVSEIRTSDATPKTVARYHPNSEIRWLITPARTVTIALGLVIIAEQDGRRQLFQPDQVRQSTRGVIEVSGPLQSAVPITVGRWNLRFAIGPKDAQPTSWAALVDNQQWSIIDDHYAIEVLPLPRP